MVRTGTRFSKKSSGFTLLEVLVALVILAVGLLGTVLLETTTVTGNAFSREMQAATLLGEDLLERVDSYTYDDPLLNIGTHQNTELDLDGDGTADALAEVDESGDAAGMYDRDWSVSAGPIPNAKTVTVTVTWTVKGTNHSVSLSTIKHQNAQ